MAKLGIDLIFAHCPQACGRIERSFATLQDRLLKELALEGISDPEQASRYFNQVFIPHYTKKFAVEPKDPVAAWRPSPNNLKEMLCRNFTRKVKNNLTISVEGRILQLKPKKFFVRLSGRKVEVKEFFDGTHKIFHPEHGEILYEELGKKEQKRRLRLKIRIGSFKGVTFSLCKNSDIFAVR